MHRLVSWVSIGAGLLWAATSLAQPADDYQRIATAGQRAFNAGNYQEAHELWQEAHRLSPNPRVLRLMGRALSALGNHAEAARMFRLALGAPANGRPLSSAHRAEVERESLPAALEHVGEVEVRLEPAEAEWTIDGQPPLIEGARLLLSIGRHTLAARHAGYVALDREFEVVAGENPALIVELVRERASERRSPPVVAVTTTAQAAPVLDLELVGQVALLAGAGASLVAFVVAVGLAAAERDRLAASCGVFGCESAQLSDLRTWTAVADVGWVLAAAAGIAGGTWLLVDVLAERPEEHAVRVTPWASATGAGWMVSGSVY